MVSNAALLLDEAAGAFAPEGDTITVRVAGNALEALDIRDGDRVVVVKERTPEFGDLAALRVDGGARTLWKVYPEGDRLHLSNGRGRWTAPAKNVEVVGVVVAVLRRFG
ncbi:MAG: S24 family peptidase [Planctomycetota bacterium]|nr:S24 family peptidase [Planctomycetota bacterium]